MTQQALSLRALYEEHFQFVWRSLRRLGVREADVPDAVQDVFIVVHRKLPEFEGRSKVTTWLFGIALRVARDRQKLAYTRRQVDDEQAITGCVDASADIAADLERKQGLALLETILDSMPIEQRAVFTLFELDGLTGDAIAELLDVPLGTVYSRLRLAREAFQRSVQRIRAREGKRPPSPPSSGIRDACLRTKTPPIEAIADARVSPSTPEVSSRVRPTSAVASPANDDDLDGFDVPDHAIAGGAA